ncbi:MAG: hypothetical protein AAGF51_09820, partial [Pseudomonadota bacterium]
MKSITPLNLYVWERSVPLARAAEALSPAQLSAEFNRLKQQPREVSRGAKLAFLIGAGASLFTKLEVDPMSIIDQDANRRDTML